MKNTLNDTFIFIPDISGFSRFVNQTAIEHSRHIISELLELIIDADEMGLTVVAPPKVDKFKHLLIYRENKVLILFFDIPSIDRSVPEKNKNNLKNIH